MKKTILLLAIIAYLLPNTLNAQYFRGGVVLGMNLAQIDGDDAAGYSKLGLHTGFMAELKISEKLFVSLELLYSQKGATTAFNSATGVDFKILLDYAEIPFLVKYRDPKGGIIAGGGLALGRLVRSRYEEDGITFNPETVFQRDFKKFDLNIVVDVSYMFKDTWGLGLRFNYSLLRIHPFTINDPSRNTPYGPFHNLFTLRTFFLFSALLGDAG